MRFGSYILLMFSIAFAFYLFGQPTAIEYVLGVSRPGYGPGGSIGPVRADATPTYNGVVVDPVSILTNAARLLSSTVNIQSLIGLTLLVVTAAALTGFSSMYFIPLVLLILFIPYLLMPVGLFMGNTQACLVFSQSGAIGAHDFNAIAANTTRDYPDRGFASAAAEYTNCMNNSRYEMPYRDVIMLFLNIITVLAMISFIRGGV